MAGSSNLESRAGEIFAGNRLLATFPQALRDQILAGARLVRLEEGEIAIERGQEFQQSLFPLGQTTLSILAEIAEGRSVEAASIGREGAFGGIVSCGHSPAFARAEVLVGGEALSVPMAVIEDVKAGSGHLRNLFCRYADYLLAQILQSAACNAFHPIDARTARWLLTTLDRAGPKLALTQGALAHLLGVQRTTLNAVIGQLQEERLVAIRRSAIEIVDRAGLERRSCGCYALVEGFFSEIIGDSGNGGSDDCD